MACLHRIKSFRGLFIVLALPLALDAQSNKPVLGIRAFENPPFYDSSTIGTGLTDLFVTELNRSGKYSIIEREALAELVGEVDLGESGYLDPKTVVPKGKIKGVEYWFFAKVTNFGAETKDTVAGAVTKSLFGDVGIYKDRADVRLDFRIIDAATGETVYADFGQGVETKKSLSFDGGVLRQGEGHVNLASQEFLESMLGRATMKALSQSIEKMNRFLLEYRKSGARLGREEEEKEKNAALQKASGRILATVEDSKIIIVDVGSNQGVKAGDLLHVYREIHTQNSQGEIVYTELRHLGRIRITEVQADRAKTIVESGTGFAEADVVRWQ